MSGAAVRRDMKVSWMCEGQVIQTDAVSSHILDCVYLPDPSGLEVVCTIRVLTQRYLSKTFSQRHGNQSFPHLLLPATISDCYDTRYTPAVFVLSCQVPGQAVISGQHQR